MTKLDIPVQFNGILTVKAPCHLPSTDAKLLATEVASARISATTDNDDAPEDSDYAEEWSVEAWSIAIISPHTQGLA